MKKAALASLTLLLAGAFAPAIAQEAKQPENATPLANQQTLSLATSGWQTRCSAKDRKTALECVVEASAVLSNNGQRLTDFSIRVPEPKAAPVMLLRVPLEVSLAAGVNVKVDEGKVFSYPLQSCNNNGCFIGNKLDQDLLKALIKGSNLVITFKDTAQNDIRLSLPLNGFGDAFAAVK
ncbi:invasion associated locus B family protein [Bacillus subtilis]|uniref:invasion associated locus B family protein n=1 Tax=Pseudochrobactrum asaccharolyticum TaxID=354351 RepID=UPI001F25E699|nr:invasion associated locus B family protein [Pseudochrobactrum asaccharolyticum]MCF7647247.1 invasion associated locus B family protein [Pseudochrobactrum asaccharolyticum]MCF7672816.1 invasion associated locus B family protein [Bacillus subtilis]